MSTQTLKEQLLNIEQSEIASQLQKLNSIESNIISKDRIIDQMNQFQEQQQKSISVLIIVLVIAIIELLIVLGYGYGKVSRGKMIISFFVVIIIYIFLFMYNYNIFYLSDAINSIFNRNMAQYLGNSVATLSKELDQDIQNQLYGSETDWVKGNCNCPPDAKKDDTTPVFDTITVPQEKKRTFYYDGTAPAQQMLPTPDPKTLTEKIDWVDFSKSGNFTYDKSNNTINYDTNTFYNNENTTDPQILQKKALNNATLFTNNQTYTSNL